MNSEVQKTAALASLTATYTDSDADSDSDNDMGARSENVHEVRPSSRDSTPGSETNSTTGARRHPSRLVSYNMEEVNDDEDESLEDISYEMEDRASRDEDESSEQSPDHKHVKVDSRPTSPIPYHRSLLGTDPETIALPPEPLGRCSNSLQEKISRLYEKKIREGKDMNASIQQRKDFRNPSIYEKLISYCGIDELGTNYPPELYDPHSWGPQSFYEELAKRQKEEMDKREKEKKERTKVEFMSGTAKKPQEGTETNPKRKSKWDTVGANQAVLLQAIKPATLITNPPAVVPVTVPTGTKPTVISAFGMLPKKTTTSSSSASGK